MPDSPHVPGKPSTLDLIDQASMLVQSAAVSGVPVPIEELATWEGQAEDKLTALFYVHQRLDGEVNLLSIEIDRLIARSSSAQKDQDRVKSLAASLMLGYTETTGRKKCKTPTLTFSVLETKVVHIYDEDKLPASFWVTPDPKPPKPRVDKAAVKGILKAGVTVPGAELTINHHMRWK